MSEELERFPRTTILNGSFRQYSRKRSRKTRASKEIIVINGKAINAQITTCAEYVAQRWKLAFPLLDALDAAKKGVQKFENIHILDTKEWAWWQNPTIISVRGELKVQADSASNEISRSRSSIKFQFVENEVFFAIESLPLERVTKEISCWHQLFAYMVVAPD
ncbi:hypothetical protein MMC17_003629 [Xylographa soralifera]|nr:hypothetical protein [Xylographa soralifera]